MSRIGKQLITLPDGVNIALKGRTVSVDGPKGKLALDLTEHVDVAINDKTVQVECKGADKAARSMYGTTRALINNMVTGVSAGFTKVLQIWGVGYSCEVKKNNVSLNIGFCHSVEIPIPEGIDVKAERISIEGTNVWQLSISGSDKQIVGQLAADIRVVRPPEPYKGKGIRYENERIIRKAGKSFQSTGG